MIVKFIKLLKNGGTLKYVCIYFTLQKNSKKFGTMYQNFGTDKILDRYKNSVN